MASIKYSITVQIGIKNLVGAYFIRAEVLKRHLTISTFITSTQRNTFLSLIQSLLIVTMEDNTVNEKTSLSSSIDDN